MTKYNGEHNPPAPVAYITLRNTDTQETILNVPMLLDTGADVTLVPRAVCEQIGISIERDDTMELICFEGSTTVPDFVSLDFIIFSKMFRGKFLVYNQDEGIIGRDVLYEFKLILDGPNLEWEHQES